MTQKPNPPHELAWTRANVNLRLSRRRREQLKALLAQLPDSSTPTDVIDHALRIALAADRTIEGRLLDMEDAAEERDMQQRFEFDRMQASIAKMAEGVKALQTLIAEVAQADEL